MLIIRDEQMEAFRPVLRERFCRGVLAELRAADPDPLAGMDDAEALERVAWAVALAEAQGFFVPEHVRRFARLAAAWGPGFEERAELAGVVEALNDPELAGLPKLERLEAAAPRG